MTSESLQRKRLEAKHARLIELTRLIFEAGNTALGKNAHFRLDDGELYPVEEADELARVGIYETELALEKTKGGW